MAASASRAPAPSYLSTAAAAWGSRLVVIACQLLSIRVVIAGYGDSVYAGLVLVISLATWAALLDAGLGATIQNLLAEFRGDKDRMDFVVRTAFRVHTYTILAGLAVCALAAWWAGPLLFKAVASIGAEEKRWTFFFAVGGGMVSTIGQTAQRIFYGTGHGYKGHFWTVIVAVSTLVVLFVSSKVFTTPPLFVACFAYFAPGAILWSWIYFSSARSKGAIPEDSVRIRSDITKRAKGFWWFGLMASAVLQIDYLLLSQFVSSAEIVEYSLLSRIMGLAFFVFNAMILAWQPELTATRGQQTYQSVLKKLMAFIALGWVVILCCAICIFYKGPLMFSLIAPGVDVPVRLSVILWFTLYYFLRVWTDSFSLVLTAYSCLAPFWIWVPIQAVVSGLAQFFLIKKFGLSGAVAGLSLSFALTVAIALPIAVKRLLPSKTIP